MESFGTSNPSPGFDAPAPHVVVVCPSCKTSFAVETAAVAALETPRFHCSRCDDIFVLKDSPADLLPNGGLHLQSLSSSASRTTSRVSSSVADTLINNSDFSFGGAGTPPPVLIERNEEPGDELGSQPRSDLSLLAKAWSEPTPEQETVGVPPQSESTFAMWEREVAPPVAPEDITPRQFVISDPQPMIEPKQPSPQVAHSPTTWSITEEPSETPPAVVETTAKRSFLSKKAPPKVETKPYKPLSNPKPLARSTANHVDSLGIGRGVSPRNKGLFRLGAPIVGAVALVLGLSYVARLSPQSVDALMTVAAPSIAKESVQYLPPSSLTVRNLKLSFQKTRNKETVALVSGVILNGAGRSFDEVELEAIGFNERGEIMVSSRAPLRSSLNSQKVTNLSLEAINQHQHSLGSEANSIAAKEGVPFTVALLDNRGGGEDLTGRKVVPDLSRIKYFSARIFSVSKK